MPLISFLENSASQMLVALCSNHYTVPAPQAVVFCLGSVMVHSVPPGASGMTVRLHPEFSFFQGQQYNAACISCLISEKLLSQFYSFTRPQW